MLPDPFFFNSIHDHMSDIGIHRYVEYLAITLSQTVTRNKIKLFLTNFFPISFLSKAEPNEIIRSDNAPHLTLADLARLKKLSFGWQRQENLDFSFIPLAKFPHSSYLLYDASDF